MDAWGELNRHCQNRCALPPLGREQFSPVQPMASSLIAASLAIPVGWLLHLLAGRLAGGRAALPLTVGLSALAGAWLVLALPPEMLWPGALLASVLVMLVSTDFAAFLLPDALTLPLATAGLVLASPEQLRDAVAGVAAGGLGFYAVARGYRLLRGRDGLGLGDVKLLAASGAWVGWQGLASVMAVAALSGLAWTVARRRVSLEARMPFGPFLCLGLWLTWTLGPLHVA